MTIAPATVRNRLLDALTPEDRRLLDARLTEVELNRGDVLFEPGEEVQDVHFLGAGALASLVINLSDGTAAEAAMIGCEGAVGGIISSGDKPAFSRGVVQVPGFALRLPTEVLDDAKQRSATLRDHFSRYADCLLAQVLQSVACNATHDAEARLARWLLATQDRIGGATLPLTHDSIAEMIGVQRTYVTRVIGALAQDGAVKASRGAIVIVDRGRLAGKACECYRNLYRHYERMLPGVYPIEAVEVTSG